jgi:hypothetical protein
MHKNSFNKLTTTREKLEFKHSFCHMALKHKEKYSQLKCDCCITGKVQPQTDERKCEDNRANREIHMYCEKETVNSHDLKHLERRKTGWTPGDKMTGNQKAEIQEGQG